MEEFFFNIQRVLNVILSYRRLAAQEKMYHVIFLCLVPIWVVRYKNVHM